MLKSITAYFKALGLIQNLKLGKYFLIPVIISLLVGTVIFGFAYGLSDNVGVFVANIWPFEWGKSAVNGFGTFLGAISIVLVGFVLYKHIVMALASPFMSPVSEKIENYYHKQNNNSTDYLTHRNSSFSEQLARGIKINFRNLTKELLFTLLLLICGFIPVVNIFTTALLFVIQSYYAGFGIMDYTLERHFNYKDSIDFVSKHKGLAIGNGLVFMLLLLIPVVGFLIVIPLSATASSLVTVEKIHDNKLK